ncbi:hypothetical protein PG995_012456 [Apiospora arundinis]
MAIARRREGPQGRRVVRPARRTRLYPSARRRARVAAGTLIYVWLPPGSSSPRCGDGSYGSGGTGRRATTRGSGTPRVGSIDAPRQALSPEMRRTATGSVPGGLGFVLSGTNCDCYPVVLGAATL